MGRACGIKCAFPGTGSAVPVATGGPSGGPSPGPYVFEALCIRAEGIRVDFAPKVSGNPMCPMSLLQHRRIFEVGLRIIGVTQELRVLVFVSVTTCDLVLLLTVVE